MVRRSATSTQADLLRRRRIGTGVAAGLLAVSVTGALAVAAGGFGGSSDPATANVGAVSAWSQSGGQAKAGHKHTRHRGHNGAGAPASPSVRAVDYDAMDAMGMGTPAPTPSVAPPLDILANNCDKTKLPLHDGFQAGNRCVTTEFGEVGENAKNPTLIISNAPQQVRVGQAFQIKVSTRNLVRDRFLAAAQGGYYKESSLLTADGLERGHFHTACRMLSSDTLAPDPTAGSVFFKATEDKKGGSAPDVVTVDVPGGLPATGEAECAAWAGDGSHRIPMMESVQAIPAMDTVRIMVTK
jgi:hypothetical protein